MGIPTDYNPSVFHKELKKIYRIVPLSPTDNNPSVFHRELKNFYGIVPLSLIALPKDKNPLVFHRELQKNYRIVPPSPMGTPTALPTALRTSRSARMSDMCPYAQIPTALPTSNTDGFTHILKRTHVWHVSVCIKTDGFSDRSKSLAGFSNFFWCAFQLITDGI